MISKKISMMLFVGSSLNLFLLPGQVSAADLDTSSSLTELSIPMEEAADTASTANTETSAAGSSDSTTETITFGSTDSSADTQSTTASSSQQLTASTVSEYLETPTSNTQDSSKQTNEVVWKTAQAAALASMVDAAEVEDNYQYSVVYNQTTAEFIELISTEAQTIAWQYDLYASVMIAQAILETGSGNSQLSREPNYNLFGIKGSYEGVSVSYSTQEDNGSGQMSTVIAAFRRYPGYQESLEDYARLLTEGLSGNATFYASTWRSNTNSYTEATAFLTGRYATDTRYGEKLNALIETYDLTHYDQEPKAASDMETTASEVLEQSSEPSTQSSSTSEQAKETPNKQAPAAANAVVEREKHSERNVIQVPAKEVAASVPAGTKNEGMEEDDEK